MATASEGQIPSGKLKCRHQDQHIPEDCLSYETLPVKSHGPTAEEPGSWRLQETITTRLFKQYSLALSPPQWNVYKYDRKKTKQANKKQEPRRSSGRVDGSGVPVFGSSILCCAQLIENVNS